MSGYARGCIDQCRGFAWNEIGVITRAGVGARVEARKEDDVHGKALKENAIRNRH